MTRVYQGYSQWHRDRDARWLDLYNSGVSVFEIADRYHYSIEHVSMILRRQGAKLCYQRMKRG